MVLSLVGDGFGQLVPILIENKIQIHEYRYYDIIQQNYHFKSIEGSLSVFITTFVSTIIVCYFDNVVFSIGINYNDYWLSIIILSVITTFIEAFSPKGTDNLWLFAMWLIVCCYCSVKKD